ncbi:putative disease resistance RPP13-like protein 1 [Pistacia vera]|uniref:putative disease resistance RPP13-like protein 1 n=1 Tax=Pistacia vera TaxID=55513 RepID=UPI0012639F9C|nr:putative disease resistance RPP13-like protein 1 [Pistacia vera]
MAAEFFLRSGSFPSGFLQQLLDKLEPPELTHFIRKHKLDEAWLKKLKKTMSTINAVIHDAEKKQFRNPEVSDWLAQITDFCYDIEDLLDQIATQALRSKLEAESRVWDLVFTFSQDIGDRMDVLIVRLEQLGEQKDRLGLKEECITVTKSNQLPSSSLVDDYQSQVVFGRDEDKETILKLLLSGEHETVYQSDVIAIVGEAGVGKTTLAELVYNDERVKKYFDCKAWVCLSEVLDAKRLTKAILGQLTDQTSDVENRNSLQVKLKESLNKKKILLILDNVRSNEYSIWEILRFLLNAGEKGSKIIVTARSSDIAAFIGTLPAYRLKPLLYEDSWMLFAKYAFENKESSLYPKLEVIGKEIVKKCNGLPLAAKLLGCLLRFMLTVEEWDVVLKNNMFDSSSDRNGILQALMLSYYYLPAHLKRCFAYCSIFSKDYEYEEEKLILLWMAEGFLEQSRHERMEEVGHQYFQELTSRSFFQQSTTIRSRYTMHDLVHDLALILSGNYISRLPNHGQLSSLVNHDYFSRLVDVKNLEFVLNKVRHLSFCGGNFIEIVEVSKPEFLRTFLPYELPPENESSHISSGVLEILLDNLYCLRVLSLSHYPIIELPDSIGHELELLRYLDLSHTAISRLPESVNSLYNLQTLILSNCNSLIKLPRNMGSLVNLCHLDIVGTNLTEMPADIGRLTSLQKLSNFVVGKYGGSKIKDLGSLLNLRGTLHISQLQNVVFAGDASLASLKNKEELDVLELEWSDTTVDPQIEREVLEQLQPHEYLKELSIKLYNGTQLPDWLGDSSFSNMVLLRLSNCNNCLQLPPLGQLPSLKELIIKEMKQVKRVGPEFYGANNSSDLRPFPSLETLIFEGMLEWEEWISTEVEGGEFPCLQELHIRKCPKLKKSLPKCLPPSTRVYISECPELVVTLPGLQVDSNMGQLRSDHEVALQHAEHKTDVSITLSASPQETSKLLIEDTSSFKHEGSSQILRAETVDKMNTEHVQDNLHDIFSPERLKVSEISQLRKLPPNLCSLKIEGCEALNIIPGELMHSNPHLQHLYIINCCSLKFFHGGYWPTALKTIYIRDCRKLEFISPGVTIHQYPVLEHLCIGSSCDSLTEFPLSSFPKLRSLVVWDCANLNSILITEDHKSLDALEIRDCPSLEYFPEKGLRSPNLKSILLSNSRSLRKLPEQLQSLISLQSLFINECPELMSIPKGGFPNNLGSLCIISCPKLTPCKEWGLRRLEYLTRFEIEGVCRSLESFPEQELLPSNLKSLRISRLLNLKFLDYEGLQHLTCLETLEINCCGKLQSLPEEGLPSSLTFLCIKECPLLQLKLQNKKGKHWYRISHIPQIQIDEEVFS